MGMKSDGGMIPLVGCSHLIRASNPLILPVFESTMGLVVHGELVLRQCCFQVVFKLHSIMGPSGEAFCQKF